MACHGQVSSLLCHICCHPSPSRVPTNAFADPPVLRWTRRDHWVALVVRVPNVSPTQAACECLASIFEPCEPSIFVWWLHTCWLITFFSVSQCISQVLEFPKFGLTIGTQIWNGFAEWKMSWYMQLPEDKFFVTLWAFSQFWCLYGRWWSLIGVFIWFHFSVKENKHLSALRVDGSAWQCSRICQRSNKTYSTPFWSIARDIQ